MSAFANGIRMKIFRQSTWYQFHSIPLSTYETNWHCRSVELNTTAEPFCGYFYKILLMWIPVFTLTMWSKTHTQLNCTVFMLHPYKKPNYYWWDPRFRFTLVHNLLELRLVCEKRKINNESKHTYRGNWDHVLICVCKSVLWLIFCHSHRIWVFVIVITHTISPRNGKRHLNHKCTHTSPFGTDTNTETFFSFRSLPLSWLQRQTECQRIQILYTE